MDSLQNLKFPLVHRNTLNLDSASIVKQSTLNLDSFGPEKRSSSQYNMLGSMIGDFKSISVIDEVEEFQEQRQSRIATIFNKRFSLSSLFKKSTVDLQAVVNLPDHSEEKHQEIVIKDLQAD